MTWARGAAVSRKAGFAHGEPFGAPAVSKKGGFAHGEPFLSPCGEQIRRFCSREDTTGLA